MTILQIAVDNLASQMNRNRQTGVTIHKSEGNILANRALTLALGLRAAERPNWSCCHIWGIDDAAYQISNAVVQDRRFFSCVANMVLLPTPLKVFTDVMPEVKMMLRICALHRYGWSCDHEEVADIAKQVSENGSWEAYPESWPKAGKFCYRLEQSLFPSGSRKPLTAGRPLFAKIWHRLVQIILARKFLKSLATGIFRTERPPPRRDGGKVLVSQML